MNFRVPVVLGALLVFLSDCQSGTIDNVQKLAGRRGGANETAKSSGNGGEATAGKQVVANETVAEINENDVFDPFPSLEDIDPEAFYVEPGADIANDVTGAFLTSRMPPGTAVGKMQPASKSLFVSKVIEDFPIERKFYRYISQPIRLAERNLALTTDPDIIKKLGVMVHFQSGDRVLMRRFYKMLQPEKDFIVRDDGTSIRYAVRLDAEWLRHPFTFQLFHYEFDMQESMEVLVASGSDQVQVDEAVPQKRPVAFDLAFDPVALSVRNGAAHLTTHLRIVQGEAPAGWQPVCMILVEVVEQGSVGKRTFEKIVPVVGDGFALIDVTVPGDKLMPDVESNYSFKVDCLHSGSRDDTGTVAMKSMSVFTFPRDWVNLPARAVELVADEAEQGRIHVTFDKAVRFSPEMIVVDARFKVSNLQPEVPSETFSFEIVPSDESSLIEAEIEVTLAETVNVEDKQTLPELSLYFDNLPPQLSNRGSYASEDLRTVYWEVGVDDRSADTLSLDEIETNSSIPMKISVEEKGGDVDPFYLIGFEVPAAAHGSFEARVLPGAFIDLAGNPSAQLAAVIEYDSRVAGTSGSFELNIEVPSVSPIRTETFDFTIRSSESMRLVAEDKIVVSDGQTSYSLGVPSVNLASTEFRYTVYLLDRDGTLSISVPEATFASVANPDRRNSARDKTVAFERQPPTAKLEYVGSDFALSSLEFQFIIDFGEPAKLLYPNAAGHFTVQPESVPLSFSIPEPEGAGQGDPAEYYQRYKVTATFTEPATSWVIDGIAIKSALGLIYQTSALTSAATSSWSKIVYTPSTGGVGSSDTPALRFHGESQALPPTVVADGTPIVEADPLHFVSWPAREDRSKKFEYRLAQYTGSDCSPGNLVANGKWTTDTFDRVFAAPGDYRYQLETREVSSGTSETYIPCSTWTVSVAFDPVADCSMGLRCACDFQLDSCEVSLSDLKFRIGAKHVVLNLLQQGDLTLSATPPVSLPAGAEIYIYAPSVKIKTSSNFNLTASTIVMRSAALETDAALRLNTDGRADYSGSGLEGDSPQGLGTGGHKAYKESDVEYCAGGGQHIGLGGDGGPLDFGVRTYGDPRFPTTKGASGGGRIGPDNVETRGGQGGGFIYLGVSGELTMSRESVLSARGADVTARCAGGGAGGSILIELDRFGDQHQSPLLDVSGGRSLDLSGQLSGTGSGGAIALIIARRGQLRSELEKISYNLAGGWSHNDLNLVSRDRAYLGATGTVTLRNPEVEWLISEGSGGEKQLAKKGALQPIYIDPSNMAADSYLQLVSGTNVVMRGDFVRKHAGTDPDQTATKDFRLEVLGNLNTPELRWEVADGVLQVAGDIHVKELTGDDSNITLLPKTLPRQPSMIVAETLVLDFSSSLRGTFLDVRASNSVSLMKNSSIDADGLGWSTKVISELGNDYANATGELFSENDRAAGSGGGHFGQGGGVRAGTSGVAVPMEAHLFAATGRYITGAPGGKTKDLPQSLGGGIVMVQANSLTLGSGARVSANGERGRALSSDKTSKKYDQANGGGAGGTVVINATTLVTEGDPATIEARGGCGVAVNSGKDKSLFSAGGGGGGLIVFKQDLPSLDGLNLSVEGGAAGVEDPSQGCPGPYDDTEVLLSDDKRPSIGGRGVVSFEGAWPSNVLPPGAECSVTEKVLFPGFTLDMRELDTLTMISKDYRPDEFEVCLWPNSKLLGE